MSNRGDLRSLTDSTRALLSQLLDEALRRGGGIPAAKFRADHFDSIGEIDELEKHGHLRNVNDHYIVASTSLPLLGSDAANQILSNTERIYAALRQHYRDFQSEPKPIAELASKAGVPISEAAVAMTFMMDNSLWWRSCTGDFTRPEASISPSEGVLKYVTFLDAIEQVRAWQASGSGAGGTPPPSAELFERSTPSSGKPSETAGRTEPRAAILRAWPAIRTVLQSFNFYDIKEIVGLAGLDVTALAHLDQRPKEGASKGQLMTAVDGLLSRISEPDKYRSLAVLAEEILTRKPQVSEQLSEYLSRLGWGLVGKSLVPVQLLESDDLLETPSESHHDLRKAAQRFRDGDLTGAISAACAAVDSATTRVYQEKGLGDPTQASFQERCKKAAIAKGVMAELDAQLLALGWPQIELMTFRKNLEGALNQGAYVMQTLRSKMGDVHGSKPIFRPLAFDTLKWAELIVGSLIAGPDDD